MTIEAPHVHTLHITPRRRDGYVSRTYCLIYGYPGLIQIEVDTHEREYSSAEAQVFNPVDMAWDRVYHLGGMNPRLAELPVLPDRPETIDALNAVARHVWQQAEWIMTVSHERQDQVDAVTAAAKEKAQIEVRDAFYSEREAAMRQMRDDQRPIRPDANVTVTVGETDLPVDVIYNAEDPK